MATSDTGVPQPGAQIRPILNKDCISEICSYLLNDGPPTGHKDEMASYATANFMRFDREWRIGRRTRNILSFALTCKEFASFALALLWEEVDGLVRVLNVLPEFRRVGYQTYEFDKDPSPESWARFDFYAGKVRRVDFIGVEVDSWICARILRLHKEPLFPNLWRFLSTRKSSLSPTITLMAPWLRQLPMLEMCDSFSFDIHLTPSDRPEVNAVGFDRQIQLSSFAPLLPDLLALELTGCKGGFLVADLQMVASLSRLTSLTLWIEGAGWPELLDTQSIIFPALRTLDIGDLPRSLVPRFLERIGSDTLTALTVSPINFSARGQPPIIQSVLEISAQKWAPTLRTLFIDATDFTLTAAGCAPVARMTALQHLRFGSLRSIAFTDYQFLATIRPLKNLISFSAFGWRGLSIEALRHVSTCLPRLKSLDLTFTPPDDPPDLGAGYSNHSLDTLIVNVSMDHDAPWLGNVEATVCHLHHIFPSLRNIDIPSHSSRKAQYGLQEEWERVTEFLQTGCPLCS
ncbi:hypothetical protein B0H11DRAFT_2066575 [Mycena galericulata]|nr:hypothetical protein B0H11DRAFT_2066575 [Mycena galericulata]